MKWFRRPSPPSEPVWTWEDVHRATKLSMLRYLEAVADADGNIQRTEMTGWTFAECCRMNHALNKIGQGRFSLQPELPEKEKDPRADQGGQHRGLSARGSLPETTAAHGVKEQDNEQHGRQNPDDVNEAAAEQQQNEQDE